MSRSRTKAFAHEMEAMYERDLTRATEIVLGEHRRVCPVPPPTARDGVQVPRRRRSYGRATAGAIGIGSVVGAALTARRRLGAAEARLLGGASVLCAAIGIVALLWPRAVAVPVAILLIWIAVSLFARAVHIHRAASKT